MAYYNGDNDNSWGYDPRYDEGSNGDGGTPAPPDPAQDPMPTYDYLGVYPDGKNVYRGPDGQLYTDGNGMNGFVPYTAATQTEGPKPPPPPPPPGPNTMSGLLAPYAGTFTPPAGGSYSVPDAPQLNLPRYTPPPAFTHDAFVGPTYEEATNEPGFQFRLDQGVKALTNSASGRGTLRSGGTMKDILGYGQQFASNEFGNVWNRKLGAWEKNFNADAQQYATNFGVGLDSYDRLYRAVMDEYAPQLETWRSKTQNGQRQSELDYERAWREHTFDYDVFKRNQEWPYTVLSDQQKIGLTANS